MFGNIGFNGVTTAQGHARTKGEENDDEEKKKKKTNDDEGKKQW